MKQRSDKELIVITTVESNKYEQEALEAAKIEIKERNIDSAFLETQTQLIKENFSKKEKIEKELASSSNRAVHAIVDRIVFLIVFTLVNSVVFGFLGAFINEINPFLVVLYFLAFYVLFFSVQEFYFQKTVGKMLTGTSVVKNNGEKMTFSDALSRSACRLIPFDWVSFLISPEGWHDTLSHTKVVKDIALKNPNFK